MLLWPKDLTDFYWKNIFIVRISSWKISSTSNIPMGHCVIICFSRLKMKKDDNRKDYLDTFLQNVVVNFILARRDTLKELILLKLRRLVQLDVRWS